jgi:hypothetical protein
MGQCSARELRAGLLGVFPASALLRPGRAGGQSLSLASGDSAGGGSARPACRDGEGEPHWQGAFAFGVSFTLASLFVHFKLQSDESASNQTERRVSDESSLSVTL